MSRRINPFLFASSALAAAVALLTSAGCSHNQAAPAPPTPLQTAAEGQHISPARQAQINAMQSGMSKMKPEQGASHT